MRSDPPTMAKMRCLLKVLRMKFPTLAPVVVRTRSGLRVCGFSTAMWDFGEERIHHFRITLAKNLTWQEMSDTILHEWAHVVAWRMDDKVSSHHDPEWALAYSRIYTAMMGS